MKLAITDACILIDLHKLQLTTSFFELEIEIHTSYDVFEELDQEQQQLFLAFQSFGKLIVHKISEVDRINIFKTAYPKALSETDKTVLYLADQLKAMVLSSDKPVRFFAKNKCIECHGMLWIFDKLVESKILLPINAYKKLEQLTTNNFRYQNNAELMIEVKKRLQLWNS